MAAKGTILPNVHSSDPPDQYRDAVRHGDVSAPCNGKAVYKDFVQSYSTVEPAIDLTASSFLAFSWQIAGAPSGTP